MTEVEVDPPLQVTTMGAVSEIDIDEVIATIEPLLGGVDRPVSGAHLRLTHATDPAVERPAVAEVTVDVDGHVVRAQAAATNMAQAAQLLRTTLADKLRRAGRVWGSADGTRPVEVGRWPPQHVVAAHSVRGPASKPTWCGTQAVRLVRETARDAVLDMELGDYEFFLFVDALTGADCLLERRGPDTYQLISTGPAAGPEPGPGRGSRCRTCDRRGSDWRRPPVG